MLKACKRNFDCLSLYDDNNNAHDSYSSTSPYFPTRKRVCTEFNDNMYISEENIFFSTEEVIPKIHQHQTSPKTTSISPSTSPFPSTLRSFSAPISPFSQNENLPNNSKLPKLSSTSSIFSPFNSSLTSASPLFCDSPSCSSNNHFNINNNNNINVNVNNSINNNNNNNNMNNNNNNNNNCINNNNNNNNNEKNYFNLSTEFFDPKIQLNNSTKENNNKNNNNNNDKNDENLLLNRLIESKLRENKTKKNLDLIFTVEDIKEIVLLAIKERDEELHEEFSAKLTEKLIEQQMQFASYNEEKIAAKLKNSKFDYMS